MGIEHSVDTNGWSTTYQTVMRVQPSEKSNVSGRKKEFENTLMIFRLKKFRSFEYFDINWKINTKRPKKK